MYWVTDIPLLDKVTNKRSFSKHSVVSFFLAFSSTCLYSTFTEFVLTVSMQGLLPYHPQPVFWGGKGRKGLGFLRPLLGERGRKPFSAVQSSLYRRLLSIWLLVTPLNDLELYGMKGQSDWYPQTCTARSWNSPQRLFISSPCFVGKDTDVQGYRTNKRRTPEENSCLQALSPLLFLPHQLKTWVNEFKKLVLASGLNSLDLHPAHFTLLQIPPDPCKHFIL